MRPFVSVAPVLFREVNTEDSGSKFHEQDHADNTEGIGDPIADRREVGSGTVYCRGKARRTRQRTGEEPDGNREVEVEEKRETGGEKRAKDDDRQRNHDQLDGLALKGGEKLRPGLHSYGEHEEDQSEGLDNARYGNAYSEYLLGKPPVK